MNKKLIRLTENDLHKIVKESVQRILNEADGWHTYFGDNMPPAEKEFREMIGGTDINQSNIDFLGQLTNGNYLMKCYGILFEVTPRGEITRVEK